ncbi:MAG: T9SS type A sorting domain-containing protein [Ignavibacteriaceae bacterium]|nr:T9SS type A sorting domain-containing protein [Ignavibacteriaceae bacterium]
MTSIEPTNDNGFIFTIYGPNISFLKCYESGILAWEKIVGGPQDDQAYSINLTSDSGYIVTGYTKSFGAGNSDIWLLKFKNNLPNNITVVSPNGGEHLSIRDTIEIKWNSVSVDSVRIKLSLNGGTNWITIVDSTPSDSTYKWFVQVPNPSWNCLIKISDVADSTIYDKSDSTFAIDRFLSIDDSSRLLPKEFSLSQNFPNPFNPSTKIKFQIPGQARNDNAVFTLNVYDVLGNEIATLINEEKQPGEYEVEFNGSELPSGIYFYQLKAGNYIETKKMMLLK